MALQNAVFPTGVGMDRVCAGMRTVERVFPTGVGMNRRSRSARLRQMCSPRAWGWTAMQSYCDPMSGVPHGRGDGPSIRSGYSQGEVFPTGVGMDRTEVLRWAVKRVPHGRGDGPPSESPSIVRESSPRAWGWTGIIEPQGGVLGEEFPTGVGMDRVTGNLRVN